MSTLAVNPRKYFCPEFCPNCGAKHTETRASHSEVYTCGATIYKNMLDDNWHWHRDCTKPKKEEAAVSPPPTPPSWSVGWHNPDKMTDAGEGWRFCIPEELDGRHVGSAEFWYLGKNKWLKAEDAKIFSDGRNLDTTYRVPIDTPFPPDPRPIAESWYPKLNDWFEEELGGKWTSPVQVTTESLAETVVGLWKDGRKYRPCEPPKQEEPRIEIKTGSRFGKSDLTIAEQHALYQYLQQQYSTQTEPITPSTTPNTNNEPTMNTEQNNKPIVGYIYFTRDYGRTKVVAKNDQGVFVKTKDGAPFVSYGDWTYQKATPVLTFWQRRRAVKSARKVNAIVQNPDAETSPRFPWYVRIPFKLSAYVGKYAAAVITWKMFGGYVWDAARMALAFLAALLAKALQQ